jgi:hypothetical protein
VSRRLDLLRGFHGTGLRRADPHRFPARVHPSRGHPMGQTARARVVEQGQGSWESPRRRQGPHRPGRRRDGVPLQRVAVSRTRRPTLLTARRSSGSFPRA